MKEFTIELKEKVYNSLIGCDEDSHVDSYGDFADSAEDIIKKYEKDLKPKQYIIVSEVIYKEVYNGNRKTA